MRTSKPTTKPQPTQPLDLRVRLPKHLYDALQKVVAARPATDRYSIKATVKLAERMGETGLAEWITHHQNQYACGFWYGFYVDSNYPGDTDR
jgi:uncharacterized protein with NAD-binding domain and iron-sulfur cluster